MIFKHNPITNRLDIAGGKGNPFDYLQLKTNVTPQPNAEGLIQWNATEGRPSVGTTGGEKIMAFVDDLSEYEKLAISTTQANLYTNLIPNNLLIPNQWYLITDFLNDDVIANTYISHIGLTGTYTDKDGNTEQLTYDNGSPITDGATEEIYLRASSPNTLYPVGYSKTFSREQITFSQNMPPILKQVNYSFNGEENVYFQLNAYTDSTPSIINEYSEITLESVDTAYSITLGGTNIANFSNHFFGNGNNYFYIYNAHTDTSIDLYESGYGTIWTLDGTTGELNFPNGDFDFTGFETVEGSNIQGYISAGRVIPFTGSTSGEHITQNSTELYIDEVISSTQIKLGGSEIDNFDLTYFRFNLMDYNKAVYVTLDQYNLNIDWFYDPTTKIITTTLFDFSNIIYQNVYGDMFFEYSFKTFQGLIIERYVPNNNLRISINYRSKLHRRYKAIAIDLVAGTYNAGDVVRYNGNIYMAIDTTTSLPNETTKWIYIFPDQYLLANDLTIKNFHVYMDTNVFIDTPTINTNYLIHYPTKVVNNTITANNIFGYDTVIYGDILQSYLNSYVDGYNLTIHQSCINSRIKADGSTIAIIANSSIALSININIVNLQSSTIAYSSYSHLYYCTNLITLILNYSIFNYGSNNLFFDITDSIFEAESSYNTVKTITGSKFNNTFSQNNIALISDSNFSFLCTRNTIDYMANSTFYGNCQGSRIPFMSACNFNSWNGVVIKKQVFSCNCLANWTDSTFGGDISGLNVPITADLCNIELMSSINGTGTININSLTLSGLYSITLNSANVFLLNISGNKIYDTTFNGYTNISSTNVFGLFYGTFGESARTVSSVVGNLLTSNGHGYIFNQLVRFSSTGTLPANISENSSYYIMSTGLTANSFNISNNPDNLNQVAVGSSWTGTLSVQLAQQIDSCLFLGNAQGNQFLGTRVSKCTFPSPFDGKIFKSWNTNLNIGTGYTGNIIDFRSTNTLSNTTRIGSITNYSEFEPDGTLKMIGNATTWEDIDFPLIAKTTGAGTPNYNTFQGKLTMLQWAVNDSLQCDSEELVHGWKEASLTKWHFHLVTGGTDTTSRYVNFELEYTWANFGATFPTNTIITSGDLLIPANTPARTHLIFGIQDFTPTEGKIGAHVKVRFKRIASTGTAPTSNPFIELLQLHIEKDTIGSRTVTTK